jgi:hypothetical protein
LLVGIHVFESFRWPGYRRCRKQIDV